jgi:hypothetical protein
LTTTKNFSIDEGKRGRRERVEGGWRAERKKREQKEQKGGLMHGQKGGTAKEKGREDG